MPAETGEIVRLIPLGEIRPSPFNPRKGFPKAELEELADSIRAQGILAPLVARGIAVAGAFHFELIAGERRLRAAQIAGLKHLPVIVREATDAQARELQILENLQRADIAPLEEAAAFQDLLKAANAAQPKSLGVDELAARVGKKPRYVYARLELLKLAPPVQKALAAGAIAPAAAQELVRLKPEQQEELLEDIVDSDYGPSTVEEIRREIDTRFREKPQPSQAEIERKKKFAAEEKRRRAVEAKQRAKLEAERKIDGAARARTIQALWGKMNRKLSETDRSALLLLELEQAAHALEKIANAMQVAAGGKVTAETLENYAQFRKAAFAKASLDQKLVLTVLAVAIEESEWNASGKWFQDLVEYYGVDAKRIRRDVAAELAAKEKPPVQTPAKTGSAKAKGKARGKAK